MRIKKIGLFCGAKLFRKSDWKRYPLFEVQRRGFAAVGFSIGPILFWDGH